MLKVTVEERRDGVILRCAGVLGRGHERAILCAAVGELGRNVVVDLAAIAEIDGRGIGSLIALQASGIYLQLRDPSPAVLEAVRAARLESVFEILEETGKEAGDQAADSGAGPQRPRQAGRGRLSSSTAMGAAATMGV